jgi:integrase
VRLLPSRYRLPALVLDACGMRIGELEALRWEDVDEPRGRWRIATSKTGRPRWATPPVTIFAAVMALVAREDRVPDWPVFQGLWRRPLPPGATASLHGGRVPSFSPHDLRHRRVTLLHLGGMPWARIGELVGHDDLVTTARTYTHVVADEGRARLHGLAGLYSERKLGRQPGTEIDEVARVSGRREVSVRVQVGE